MSNPVVAPVAVEYPDSDGKPAAEGDVQLGYGFACGCAVALAAVGCGSARVPW